MLKPYTRADLNFETIREIGAEGKNSTTFLVRDVQLDAEVVMKRINKEDLDSAEVYFAEAQALYSTAHPNVVQVLYACEDNDYVYIAMPFYQQGSVKSLMGRRHLTVREIIKFSCQMLSGLHNIHSKGLIHFDIKPDNILLSDRGEALLSDFGLAKQMELGQAEQSKFYLKIVPPEILSGGPYNLCFDIYQFGLTLYRMCCGEDTFYQQFEAFFNNGSLDRQAFAQALNAGEFPDRSRCPHHIPKKLWDVVKKCLEVSPNDRYQSALSVANALAEVDQCLDWLFEEFDDRMVWSKEINGTTKRFTLNHDSSTNFESVSNGRVRRTRDLCIDRMTTTQVRRVLRDQ